MHDAGWPGVYVVAGMGLLGTRGDCALSYQRSLVGKALCGFSRVSIETSLCPQLPSDLVEDQSAMFSASVHGGPYSPISSCLL